MGWIWAGWFFVLAGIGQEDSVHHRMLSSIPGIYTLIISSHPTPSYDNQKCLQTKKSKCSRGGKNHAQVRIIVLLFPKTHTCSVHLPPSDINSNATVLVRSHLGILWKLQPILHPYWTPTWHPHLTYLFIFLPSTYHHLIYFTSLICWVSIFPH